MEQAEALRCVCSVVEEIFEREQGSLSGRTLLMQDLPCESIDLLEIAARISQAAGREVDDEALFLKSLRSRLAEEPASEASTLLACEYPWLSRERCGEILEELRSPAPFLRLQDMAAYLAFLLNGRPSCSV